LKVTHLFACPEYPLHHRRRPLIPSPLSPLTQVPVQSPRLVLAKLLHQNPHPPSKPTNPAKMHLTPHYGYENIARRRGQENYSVRIFSAKEMAFNILGTMHPLSSLVQLQSGMDRLMDLADIMAGQKSEWDCITILLK
jgi:hypothetical protein